MGDEAAVASQFSGHGVNLSGFQTFGERERGKNAGQALGHHALATTRRAYHDQVVAAGSCYFEGALHVFLSADIGEIELVLTLLLVEFTAGVNLCGVKMGAAVEEIDDIRQGFHAIDLDIIDYGGFADVLFGYNEASELLFTCLDGDGKCTANGLQASVESQFAYEHIVGQ